MDLVFFFEGQHLCFVHNVNHPQSLLLWPPSLSVPFLYLLLLLAQQLTKKVRLQDWLSQKPAAEEVQDAVQIAKVFCGAVPEVRVANQVKLFIRHLWIFNNQISIFMRRAAAKAPPPEPKKPQKREPNLGDYVRPGLTIDMLTRLKKLFDKFDKDEIGKVQARQIRAGLRVLGLQERSQRAVKYLEEYMSNKQNDPFMDFQTFLRAFAFIRQDEPTPQEIYKHFDLNSKGFVDHQDLVRVTERLKVRAFFPDKKIEEMIQTGDKDKDGVLQQQEFVGLLNLRRKDKKQK